MKIYISSDPHFLHTNILKHCDRPNNVDEIIFKELYKIPEDATLIVTGDICVGKDKEAHNKFIIPLNCRKILVKGNHDNKSNNWYLNNGWDWVCDSMMIQMYGKKIMFTHKPVHWDGDWDLNIHGHLHNLSRHAEHDVKSWNILYAPELNDYKPWLLESFIGRLVK